MPSDTAFLSDWSSAGGVVSSYDSLGQSADALAQAPPMAGSGRGVSPRVLAGTINNLRGLGIHLDEDNAVLKGLRAAIMTNYSLYMLYGGWTALRRAQTAKETVAATIEASALAVAQQWHLIAQGAAAAALTYSAFKVGEKFGSGDWSFPSFDTSDPVARRESARQLANRGV